VTISLPNAGEIGRYFRAAGLGAVIDFERRNQADRYQPWLGGPTRLAGEGADLYRLLHCGEALRPGHCQIASGRFDALRSAELCSAAGPVIGRAKWKVSHFRDLFCVADSPADGASAVYVGDDSFIFADFVGTLPRAERGLDLGSGSGISTAALARNCSHVTGIDIAPECEDAGYLTAALNGCADRASFHGAALDAYRPQRRFDIVVANPPGVPIPKGLEYGLAGRGGDDGLELVLSFLDAATRFCKPDGLVAMRFQSLALGEEILAHSRIGALTRSRGWDTRLIVDICVPVEVRSALTAQNALPLNPTLGEAEILRRLDSHVRRLGATSYTSTLMLVHLAGRGRTTVQKTVNSVQLDTKLAPAGKQALTVGEVAAVQARFACLLGNAAGIMWRICSTDDIAWLLADIDRICRTVHRSDTVREALHLLWPDALAGPSIRERGKIIPTLLVAEALVGGGYVRAEA
jgi:predicted RNA methylase